MANEIGSTLLNTLTNSSFDVGNMAKVLAQATVAGPLSIIDRKSEKFNTELSALNYLQANLKAFNSYAKDLTSPTLFSQRSVTSTNESVVSATVTGSPIPASYNIETLQLAQAHTMVSGTTYGSVSDTVGVIGDKISINGKEITIDASNNTLEGLQRAINGAGAGVSASVINNAGQYQLMLSANSTGASSQFSVVDLEVSPGVMSTTAAALGFDVVRDAFNNPMTEGRDAIMKLNGVELSSSSNTFDNVIEGVSFNVHSINAGVQSVSIGQNTSAVVESIRSFVDVYNQLNTILKDVGSYRTLTAAEMEDPEREFTGDLAGSSVLRELRSQIRDSMTGALTGLTGSFNSLATIGISMQISGELKIDDAVFENAATNNIDALSRLFSSGGASTDPLIKVTSTNEKTQEGSYQIAITQQATRAIVTGDSPIATGAALDLTLADQADRTFQISVDGGSAVSIVMEAKNYNTPEEFVAAMTTAINGNADIAASGARVSASIQGGALVLTSNRFGGGSSIDMSAFAPAGFTVDPAVVNGTNVDGTITMANGSTLNLGAYSDPNDGRKVKISDFAVAADGSVAGVRGLQFEVSGGAMGGSIDVTKGYAGKVFEAVNNALDPKSGLIGLRVDSLNSRLGEMEEKREKLDLRFEKMELKYRTQFAMLQSIMSNMQGTRDFLTATYNRSNNN